MADIEVTRYLPHQKPETGLVATVTVRVCGLLVVSGIRVVRRKDSGRYFLVFPEAQGWKHVYPCDHPARRRFENAVFAALCDHERAAAGPPSYPEGVPV